MSENHLKEEYIEAELSPIERLLLPLDNFLKNKPASGILLFLSVVVAMIWVNSGYAEGYHHLWETKFSLNFGDMSLEKSLHHWINDGLMAIFFFVVGLEIKREIIIGDLSKWSQASLPIVAAIGGMVMPALIFYFFNAGEPTVKGWGVPMATDIAFTLGVLSVLGKRVPVSLKIFLTALAIVDDLGAVLIIAFFYTENLFFLYLEYGAIFFMILIIGNFLGVRQTWFYVLVGILGLWIAFLLSGVHATIAGVLLAFTIPAKSKINMPNFIHKSMMHLMEFKKAKSVDGNYLSEEQQDILEDLKDTGAQAESPLQRMEHALNPFVSFLVLPLFALSNAGVEITDGFLEGLFSNVSLGIFFGLVLGKFLGIFGFSAIFIKMGLAKLPPNSTWAHLVGAGVMAGIGFTMSIFISDLAFNDPEIREQAKISILIASIAAGLIGTLIFRYFTSKPEKHKGKNMKELVEKGKNEKLYGEVKKDNPGKVQ